MRLQTAFIILILACTGYACSARQLPDSTPVTVRNFAPEKIRAYQSDPAFRYNETNDPAPSAWERFWMWLWSKIDKILSRPGSAFALKTILIVIASGLLLFFALKLSGMSNQGLFSKKNTGDPLEYTTSDEDIYAINFNKALQQAMDGGNFRLAIRLLYLQSLKMLADRDIIQWQINKTNSAYVKEVKDPQLQRQFDHLTMQFENYWYGNMPLQASGFAAVSEQFEAFNKQLI